MPTIMKLKISLDIAMTVFMVLAMSYQITGILAHEIIGMLLFFMFLAHTYLNRRWYGSLFEKNRSISKLLSKIINILLVGVMILLFASGIMISQHLFSFLSLEGSLLARQLHVQAAYSGYVLISIHLGLHWLLVLNMLKKLIFSDKKSTVVNFTIFYLLPVAIFVYGLKISFAMQIGSKIIAPSPFSFISHEESALKVLLDFAALMGMCIVITHIFFKLIRKLKCSGKQQ